MLDNAVGGAVDESEMPFEALLREAKEELGIDAGAAVSGGTISWFNIKDASSGADLALPEPAIQYVYDLEVDKGDRSAPRRGRNRVAAADDRRRGEDRSWPARA